MKNARRRQYLTRDAILNLLSDKEVAAVSLAESAPSLPNGDEYLDLQDVDHGVRRAAGPVEMGHVLPKKAVSEMTWNKILGQLWTESRREVRPRSVW